ncbi:MAG TPA: E2/UBC family protein, partial [Catalimonadaceae bacterium]|nr:E2/UBC family protein [Catalimonadaceae bacterium]
EGYNHSTVTVAIQVTSSYPQGQIDMACFYPALARKDGRAMAQLTEQTIDGKIFQQWSRHREPSVNPWRPGVDDVSTHLKFVETWLQDELKK